MDKLFGRETRFETEDEIMCGIMDCVGSLSPENLSCDGELSRSAIVRKEKEILTAWAFLEKKLGRKVSENQAYEWWHSLPKNKQSL